ncbi:hypothetical protein [Methylosinus sp. Ce-a6]|uniref:hypothetical protein n=1 Tax=Methylosinus sp. Ce-a6 TaxID=2172005 RepID=UPI00135BD2C7|nr:hypothetical protein [Methylosinus sp. Ce-a6]
MTDFATILDDLEKAARRSERPSGPLRGAHFGTILGAEAPSAPRSDKDRAARVCRAYGLDLAKPEEPPSAPPEARAPRLPEREEVFAELLRAEGSLAKLATLRRRLAWSCHPDRQEKSRARQAERLLAECNAQIDQAVARAKALR